jgi:isopenicillin N synthase-like dioxygenase
VVPETRNQLLGNPALRGKPVFSETIPVIDLGSYFDGTEDDKRAVGRAVDAACRSLGFLVVSGHRVAPALIADIRAVSFAYFDLPTAEKLALRMPADRYRGYTPMLADNLAASLGEQSPPDLREAFSIGPVDTPRDAYHTARQAGTFFADNVWPACPPGMRDVYTRYYQAMEGLASSLMRVFALGLDLPEHFFDDKVNRHISNFSVLHYPVQTQLPRPGQIRAGAHTDYGSLTILSKDAAPGGLQVQSAGGGWIDVPDVPDTFVVNLGDLMQDWTGGRWRSTLHRVINPPPQADPVTRRMSMAFFHQPNYDTVIDTLPNCGAPDGAAMSGTVTSGEHVLMKIARHRKEDLRQRAQAEV